MRALLGIVVVLLLAACGDSSPGRAPATPTSQPDTGYVASEQLVTQTAGGGHVERTATPLPDDAAVDAFTRGLERGFATKIRDAVDATVIEAGQQIYGQVVAVGCDVPPGITVVLDPVAVRPEPVSSPKRECFAPVTTVAVVVVS